LQKPQPSEAEVQIPRSSEDGLLPQTHEDVLRVRLVCYEESFSLRRRAGQSDGFPYQRFDLDAEDILAADFQIMIREGGGFTQWEKVDDFDGSGPESRHYIINESVGEIVFGDGEQGLAPEGDILIIGCSFSQGQAGNVREGRINTFAAAGASATAGGSAPASGGIATAGGSAPASGNAPAGGIAHASAINPSVAAGGAGLESLDEAFLRVRRELRQPERAVTYADYENLVRSTPGLMIQSCKAIPVTKNPRRDGSMDENAVSVVVQPFSIGEKRKLNRAYIENISRHLEGKRLLGTRVNILSPEYVGIRIYAEILVRPYYRDAGDRIKLAVESFFGGAAWDFGKTVQYSAIYGVIDTLDCVLGIQALTVDAQGKGIMRGMNGDVNLPQNGMAYLQDAEYIINAGE
jgi:hypothetical protein